MAVGARQSFQFFRQITWFLRNNRALSKFRYRILYYQIIKSPSVKTNFVLTTQSTVTYKASVSKKIKHKITKKFKQRDFLENILLVDLSR